MNTFPGLVHTARQAMKAGVPEVCDRKDRPRAKLVIGLSRNKVAVPEGAAGTPPFWRGCLLVDLVDMYLSIQVNRLMVIRK